MEQLVILLMSALAALGQPGAGEFSIERAHCGQPPLSDSERRVCRLMDAPRMEVRTTPVLCLGTDKRPASAALIGRSLLRAERLAERSECLLRVLRRNGVTSPARGDYRRNRINVAVRNDAVVRVLGLY